MIKPLYIKRLLLHNILAEEIVIGYLLSSKLLRSSLNQSINRYFFSLRKYQIIYSNINNIITINQEKHIIQVINTLWDTKLLHELGGITSIVLSIQKSQNIYMSHSEHTHLKYLINILHYYYLKRLFVQYSNSIIQLNYFYKLSIKKIYKKSVKYLNSISDIYNIYKKNQIEQDITSFLFTIQQQQINNTHISSGFKDLDRIIKGFRYEDLIIIAGRPSMGKTSLAINIIYHLSIKLKITVQMFSLEMSTKEILNKLLSLTSNINSYIIDSKLIKKEEWLHLQKACKLLRDSPISIDDNGDSSLDYIKSQCQDGNINNDVIIIDYLQLIKVENEKIENRAQEIGNITRELKLLAKNIKSIIIILSQLNRNIENRTNKRPLLSDLRESGCIDYSNMPKIQYHSLTSSIETLHCLKEYYLLNRVKNLFLYENSKQYIFGMINFTQILLCTTHNHRIKSYNYWNKEDQIKCNFFHLIKQNNITNIKLTVELCRLFSIKRLDKVPVYDLELQIYHNFTINNYFIHNSIEQDADLILMLYKNEENIDHKIIDIVIAKHRHGPVGAFQLLFHADICKFSNIQNLNLLN